LLLLSQIAMMPIAPRIPFSEVLLPTLLYLIQIRSLALFFFLGFCQIKITLSKL
jgi:hypothetical protein